MDFDTQSLKAFVSPKELTDSILQKRLARVSARKPGFRLAFPSPIISFVWLFCVFASFSIAFFSLSAAGRMAAKTTDKLLPLFLGGAVAIPLGSSVLSLKQSQKRHRAELSSCQRESITEVEVVEYFEGCKSSFLLQYQEYVDRLKSQLNLLPETETALSPDLVRVRERVADTLKQLENLKHNYLSRLDSIERDFIEQLRRGREELFMESAAELELVLEHLNGEVDIANTYLKAAGEVDGL
ncbi:MAG: hypothetical protein F6J93_38560 [Oscillatoria sp. SIO1A7]|nr:hypothetical protein [Oscillatoria sp. SIO1A7]